MERKKKICTNINIMNVSTKEETTWLLESVEVAGCDILSGQLLSKRCANVNRQCFHGNVIYAKHCYNAVNAKMSNVYRFLKTCGMGRPMCSLTEP